MHAYAIDAASTSATGVGNEKSARSWQLHAGGIDLVHKYLHGIHPLWISSAGTLRGPSHGTDMYMRCIATDHAGTSTTSSNYLKGK